MAELLLTGATGLLGRRLLRDATLAGLDLAVLVRASGQAAPVTRVARLMRALEAECGQSLRVPEVVAGDLADPAILADPGVKRALRECRAVLHAAASVAFEPDRATGEPGRSNRAGTANLVALCRDAGVDQFHHVSTAYVCGARVGRMLETELDVGQRWNNEYEESKVQAEALVLGAGLPAVTIYRPSIILGEPAEAAVAHGFDTLVKLGWELGGQPSAADLMTLLGLAGDQHKNLVPVGWVAQAILKLVAQPRLHGRTYHLTHPRPRPAAEICAAIVAAIAAERGGGPQPVPAASLSGIARGLAPYRPYLALDPEFDSTHTREALPDLPCPDLDVATLTACARGVLQRSIQSSRRRVGPKVRAPIDGGEQGVLRAPLAIVGMACRLPGAVDLDGLWDLVAAGRDAIAEWPPERLDRELYHDPRRGVPGRTYSTIGGFVPTVEADPRFTAADPCHRAFGQVALEALRDAGLAPAAVEGRRIGVWVGHSGGSPLGPELAAATLAADTAAHLHEDGVLPSLSAAERELLAAALAAALREGRPRRDALGGPELEANEVAAQVARGLGLVGPALAIDAACASSLVALALAALSLQRGEVEAAIVGGASWNKAESLILFSQAQSCSATGSRPFDQEADGLIASEGFVAVVVKTLARALADGDHVRAVVRGIGLATDGRSRHLWAPRREGQLAALARAYGPGVDPGRVQYVEAHATSTQVGDATELAALAEFFGPHLTPGQAAVGSLKSNVGHTLEAAGLASLVKTVLALERRRIPPTANVHVPNRSVDWERSPFALARELQPWPEPTGGGPRRAGVSAFGIGGLNAHVVLDEFEAPTGSDAGVNPSPVPWGLRRERSSSAPKPPTGSDAGVNPAPALAVRPESEPIAIVGRGLVVPGASGLRAFQALLASDGHALGSPPDSRWRDENAVTPGPARPWHTPTRRGGYLVGSAMDWRRLEVPPRQLERGNPLQFLLLDAVRQALGDAGRGRRELDRAHTGVVVGAVFGGDFANQLQAGLRLPEARRHLRALLALRGLDDLETARAADTFEQAFLASRPALLDETGSFTSSTLASRIAKTFDLMGGALALDAGEASSLLALDAAAGLLESGACSTVLCAGAHRAMDLVAFEALSLQHRLLEPAPGEGVVVLLLKRLADARRDGDRVHGVFHGRGVAFGAGQPGRALTAATASAPGAAATAIDPGGGGPEADALAASHAAARRRRPLAEQVGHLGAAHGLASVVRATLVEGSTAVSAVSRAGLAAQVVVSPGTGTSALDPPRLPRVMLRLAASSLEALEAALATAGSGRTNTPAASPRDRFRLVAVASDAAELADAVAFAQRHLRDPRGRALLDERGVFVRELATPTPRVAWLFPGQGSQYPGMLERLLAGSSAARQLEAEARELLRARGPRETDAEAVSTQVGMLIADLCFAAAAVEAGLHRDVVAGHSYGELPALVHAGTLGLGPALGLTLARARAVAAAPVAGGLLSVAADEARVARWLAEAGEALLWITHVNAPRQTVVGGEQAALDELRARLDAAGVATRPLPVAGALHTPLVAAAGEAVRDVLRHARLRPPAIPLLSNVSLRYEAEPAAVGENLAAQLTQPLRHVDLVERLWADGCGVFVEVGPGQVLTGLNRQILEGRGAELIALDHPRHAPAAQLVRARALLECLGAVEPLELPRGALAAPVVVGEIEEFDATRGRRRRARRRALGRSRAVTDVGGAAAPAESGSALERFVVDFVVEHTGYPREAVRLDWDLEADLGVDSIKRAQLLGELGELIGLDAERTRALGAARHLRELVARAEDAARAVGSPLASGGVGPEPAPVQSRPDPSALPAPAAAEPQRLSAVTRRYVVRLEPAPRRLGSPTRPRLHGAVAVLGSPDVAAALGEQLAPLGTRVHALPFAPDVAATVEAFERLWQQGPVPHLVLATPRDAARSAPWAARRAQGVTTPFWLAQRWLTRVREADLGDDASLSALVHLGGAFGTDGQAVAAESGALCGLLKAVSVESWVAGWRALAVRIIDAPPAEKPEALAAHLLRELAAPSHDLEVAWSATGRQVVRVVPEPIAPAAAAAAVADAAPRRGGTWVCSGGARGVTARIARELGARYGLRLHLLGSAPAPDLPVNWRQRAVADRQGLRLEVMHSAHARGLNAVREWEAVEKAVEIDATLAEMAAAGIEARYHSCDVGDAEAVVRALEEVRRTSGPIEGVLHGAGYSRDARFEDKRPEKVERCIASKVDGAVHLLESTRPDPVRHFLAMGSISGRFGANGHADYSMANDLLAKWMVAARGLRPGLAATVFHWHAWDDAGMATRPESRLALELAGLHFMPAREGVAHLVAELEAGLPEAEVVITDERYPRLFQALPEAPCAAAMLAGASRLDGDGEVRFAASLDPAQEPLLQDHLLEGEPLLPLVAGLELMAEAAALADPTLVPGLLQDVEALYPLRFPGRRPRQVTITARRLESGGIDCAVLVDVHGPDGRRLASDRVVMRARISAGGLASHESSTGTEGEGPWQAPRYPPADAPFHLGPRLRALRRVRVARDRLWGRLSAPAVRELAGWHRGTRGWAVPCGALDGCFYGVGVLAWQGIRAGVTLPVSLEALHMGRAASAGEACRLEVQLVSSQASRSRFDFQLRGDDGALLLAARGYEIAWRDVAVGVSVREQAAP